MGKKITKKFCQLQLSKKIKINNKELKGRDRKQILAISFSQVKNMHPECNKYFPA